MRARGARGALVAALLPFLPLALACEAPGTRLAAEQDTVFVYSHIASQPLLRFVAPDGTVRPVRDALLEVDADSVLEVFDGFYRCRSDGEATVRATKRRRSTAFTVRCRLAQRLRAESFLTLHVGEVSPALTVDAVLADGSVERVERVRASVADTTVVHSLGTVVRAVGVGRTTVTLHAGGAMVPVSVTVQQVVVGDTLVLGVGERRRWTLGPGRYEITVLPLINPREFRTIELSTEGARCQRDGRSDRTVHCFVADSGAVEVHNGALPGYARPARARVFVVRTP